MRPRESTRGIGKRRRAVAAAGLALLLIGAGPPPRRLPRAPAPAAPVAPAETDEAMLARFAAAVMVGEARGLGNFMAPWEAEDEELLGAFVAAVRRLCSSGGGFRLVSFARIAPERIFACYCAGSPGAGENLGPFLLEFRKHGDRWATSLLPQIKALAARDASAAAERRRAFARRVADLRFDNLTLSQHIAALDAAADALTALAEPRWGVPVEPDAIEGARKLARLLPAFAGCRWDAIEKKLIAAAGEERLPALGDFRFGLYLEAREETRRWRLPYAGKEGGFEAERLPFLTDEDVLRARVGAGAEAGERAVDITMSARGRAILANVALGCAGRRFAVVLDGKVIAAETVDATLAREELAIAAGFSHEQAAAVAAALNRYRAEALARCEELGAAQAAR